MSLFLKMIQVFFLAMIKYFYAPIYGLAIELNFWHTYFSLIIGGTFAFLIYYNISTLLLLYSVHLMPVVNNLIHDKILNGFRAWGKKRKQKRLYRRKFTHWNKSLVKIRRFYGMWGIILLTPVLISLPIGAFLLRKYYSSRKIALPMMIVSIVVEGFILCVIYWTVANI